MIAREGLILITIALAATGVFVLLAARFDSIFLFIVSVVFGMLTVFTTFFFRDPPRQIPETAGVLVSPADGKIVAIDQLANHPVIGGPATKISIFLSVFDVHVNRVPTAGVIDYVNYNPGEFLAAYEDKASEVNEQTEIGMTSDSGHKVVYKQIAGIIARRIVCHLAAGDTVGTGERFGLIRFGSRTDLIVPAGSRIDIAMGDKVKGGQTVIGRLPEAATGLADSTAQENDHAG
ncbi:phosphatidylserine decarboxylase family protein [bacterium]|nr:phosphatidylserine decarboxylase family protein [bacterium]